MKAGNVSSIIFCAVCFVLVSVMLTGCGKNSVDEEYAYNTVIETNENKPVAGEAEIEKVTGFVEDKEQKLLKLPYAIENTDLEITAIGKYSGIINENGTTDEVNEVLAIVVKNKSDKIVSFSSITALYDSDKTTAFNPSNLPSQMSSLVFTSTPYVEYIDVKKFEVTDSMAIMSDSLPMLDGTVGVDYKDGNFIITNLTSEELGDVYVRFKNCSDGNVYLGGATFSVMVPDVMPYETYTVPAQNYTEGTSVIVAVENMKLD